MQKRLSTKLKIFFLVISFFLAGQVFASIPAEEDLYFDRTKLVTEQIDVLKSRVMQAQNEFAELKHQQDPSTLAADHINKSLLNQSGLEIAVAKSNLDSINIELAESQQAITHLEKDIDEMSNQVNVSNIFGIKIARKAVPDVNALHSELSYQKSLLQLEKTRLQRLTELQTLAENSLQLSKTKYARVNALLKSQTLMQLKEQQVKSELGLQQQQNFWLQQLDALYAEEHQLTSKPNNNEAHLKLQREIFYASENIHLIYLKTLLSRYDDQIQQLKTSITRSNSITLLNNAAELAQSLGKQISRLDSLLKNRADILAKRKTLLIEIKDANEGYQSELASLEDLNEQYKKTANSVVDLNQQLIDFRASLDKALQQELSARQGLPGFSGKAWVDLGEEMLLVPTLTYQIFRNLGHSFIKHISSIHFSGWIVFFLLNIAWLTGFYLLNRLIVKIGSVMPDHESGHINLKWLSIKLIHRSLIDVAIIGNIIGLFAFSGMPGRDFNFLISLSCVWIFFKALIMTARLCLMETIHDRNGHDVILYYRLKRTFLMGGVITAISAFVDKLPIIYEFKDLADRLFLLFLLIVSVLLLKSWHVLPSLVLAHIDERRTYLRKVIQLFCVLVPLILLVNSAVGLLGFVNLILTISWYESIFLLVLVGYLLVRGLLSDAMMFLSTILIRHVTNGWLWTEAFLKPIDKVLKIALFLGAWMALFFFYGVDAQSPFMQQSKLLLQYHLLDILNTSITPLNILELTVAVSVLYWAARWTREFVYRLLLSRTRDLGLRNSIAIFSQYIISIIGIFVCLRVLGIDFRALTVVAGMLAFGVGLGLRDLGNNFACGFLLLIERPLKVGDTVTINGHEGDVIHIGGRAVTIRTWDHMEVLVPHTEIFNKSFVNWTARDNIVRTVFSIKMNRHDNPHFIQKMIHDVLRVQKDVLKEPQPEVYMKELADGLIEFEVRYYVNIRQVKSRVGVRSDVLVKIWDTFESHGIKPPYPQCEVTMQHAETTVAALPLLQREVREF